jgi:cell division septation protein DedD
VVSVVIFLCGVLVGRGVRTERGVVESTTASADPAPAAPAATTPQPPAGSDPTAAAPPASDELSYFSRLEKATTPQEKLKPPSTEQKVAPPRESATRETAKGETAPTTGKKTAPDKSVAQKTGADKTAANKSAPEKTVREQTSPAPDKAAVARQESAPAPREPVAPREPTPAPKEPERTAPAAGPADAAAAPPTPSGDGFAVQIAALNVRSEADAIARRLSSKGYTAYVLSPANGTPAVYRVRIGKFPTRREAESMAARLQKEEQFKPWVTR